MKAYHFLKANMTGGYGNEPPWRVGERREVKGRLVLCEWGYHYGFTPADALEHAQGPILCEVQVQKRGPKDDEKGCSRSRKLLKAVDATRVLHEVACRIAEDVLPIYERAYPGDDRPRNAIRVKRLWIEGKATNEELRSAGEAAREAWAAEATWVAASEPAARAAEAASEAASWAAAWAAWAGAREAAWGAAGARYTSWINEALGEVLK